MASPTIPTPQDTRLLLQDTVTKTANFNSAGLDLGSGFAPGGPGQRVSALIAVIAHDVADNNETYTFTLQESADHSSFAACGLSVVVSANGVAHVKGIVTNRYVRLVLVVAGTTPSITYKAWLNPLP